MLPSWRSASCPVRAKSDFVLPSLVAFFEVVGNPPAACLTIFAGPKSLGANGPSLLEACWGFLCCLLAFSTHVMQLAVFWSMH